MPTSNPNDIAIIGAGPGGLAAAMLLAASGAKVTIYERNEVIGGRSARITLPSNSGGSGGYHFDTGPTFFLMPYVLEEIFNATGKNLHDFADLRPLDPIYRLIIGRQDNPRAGADPWTVDATTDVNRMAEQLAKIHPADGRAFPKFIKDNRAKLAAAEPILRKPITSLFDLMNPASARAGLHIKPHHTVASLLAKYFDHPASRLAVSFQSKYLGMSPYDCPSLFTILPFIEYEYGIWHPIGGCNALMTAMATAAEELGVTIHTNAEVTQLDFDTSGSTPRATGLTAGGKHHTHDNIVINADATHALKHLIPEQLRAKKSGWTNTTIDSKKYSCSTYMLYLGLDGEVDHLPHHTIFVSELYKENLNDISNTGLLSEDPSVYVHNPSQIDPTLAPKGKTSLYVLMPTPNTREGNALDWNAKDRAEARKRVMHQLEHRFNITDVERRIEAEHEITPAGWAAQNINHGATFNLAHNLNQMLHKRPQHKLPGFEGIYLVGGGTHPGSGLPVIFLSSQITSKILCDKLNLNYAGTPYTLNTKAGAERARTLTESKLAEATNSNHKLASV